MLENEEQQNKVEEKLVNLINKSLLTNNKVYLDKDHHTIRLSTEKQKHLPSDIKLMLEQGIQNIATEMTQEKLTKRKSSALSLPRSTSSCVVFKLGDVSDHIDEPNNKQRRGLVNLRLSTP